MGMSYGLLVLRVVLGLVMAAHGAQKLFGWFGGGGPRGTASAFAHLGFRAPLAMAVFAGLAEVGGGLLLAAGLATPLAALALTGVMLNAISTAHWRNGFWSSSGGYEYNLLIITAAVALAATGPGAFSVDALIGWDAGISGPGWAVGVLVVGGVLAVLTHTLGRRSPETSRVGGGEAGATGTA
jgi:putative oxidoreductase